MRAATGHADFLALESLDVLDAAVHTRDDARTALGKTGHGIDRHTIGTSGNGAIRSQGSQIDLACHDGRHDVRSLGEHTLFHLDAVFGTHFLHV